MLVFCITVNTSSLDSRRSRASAKSVKPLGSNTSNIATMSDIVLEASNSAFLPEADRVVEYDTITLSQANETISSKLSYEDIQEETEDSTSPTFPKEISIAKSEFNTKVSLKIPEEKITSLNYEELSRNVKSVKRQLAKLRKKVNIKQDKFSDIEIGEGEEVLVFISPVPPSVISPPIFSDIKKELKTIVANTDNIEFPLPLPLTVHELNIVQTQTSNIAPLSKEDYFEEEDETENDNYDSQDQSPFGVSVSTIAPKNIGFSNYNKNSVEISKSKSTSSNAITFGQRKNPFIKAFSAMKPEQRNTKTAPKKIARPTKQMSRKIASVSPHLLKKDLYHTYISDNQYLSPVEYMSDGEEFLSDEIDENFYEDSEESAEEYADDNNFTRERNIGDALDGGSFINSDAIQSKLIKVKKSTQLPNGPLKIGDYEVLQMKLDFSPDSSAISGESINIIRSFAQIAKEQPTNSIEISLPASSMSNPEEKILTARRLAIVSNVLRDAGLADKQIYPVLTNRNLNSFSFRVISNDSYERLRVSKGADIFGDEENIKEYNLMKW